MLELPCRYAHDWEGIDVRDYSIQSLVCGKREMTSLVNHSGIDNYEKPSHNKCGEEAALSVHPVEEDGAGNCSKKLERFNTPSSLSIFRTIWKFLSNDFFQVLVERIFWRPGLVRFFIICIFDFVLLENLPDLVAVRVVRLNEPGAVSSSANPIE